MKQKVDEIEKKIYSLFSNITSTIGYSDVHGKIIAMLLVEDKPVSLQELSRKTNYSLASISLAIDLLEFFGVVKKIKKSGDRKVYVRLDGDLLNALRDAILIKVQKAVRESLNELEKYKSIKDRKVRRVVKKLEKETRRLERYINKLADVKIPK